MPVFTLPQTVIVCLGRVESCAVSFPGYFIIKFIHIPAFTPPNLLYGVLGELGWVLWLCPFRVSTLNIYISQSTKQPSRGTKRRTDEEQIIAKHTYETTDAWTKVNHLEMISIKKASLLARNPTLNSDTAPNYKDMLGPHRGPLRIHGWYTIYVLDENFTSICSKWDQFRIQFKHIWYKIKLHNESFIKWRLKI